MEERIAEQDYLFAKQALHEAELPWQRQNNRSSHWSGTDWCSGLGNIIASPIDGVVTEKHVVNGEAAAATDTIRSLPI